MVYHVLMQSIDDLLGAINLQRHNDVVQRGHEELVIEMLASVFGREKSLEQRVVELKN